MHRFFLPEDCFKEGMVAIPGKLAHRLRNVLRLGVGGHIVVLDNSGWEYEVELGVMDGSKVEGKITGKAPASGEPKTGITLYQALLKGSSFELVLQKCTEVGVTGFVPMLCERCVAGEPAANRLRRWQEIILEAAQQSRRGRIPVLYPMARFSEACASAGGIALMPWEGEVKRGIGEFVRGCTGTDGSQEVSIFIGPEGGFSAAEAEVARGYGIEPVSLGHRILRAETAGLVASTVILYEFGELDGCS